MAGNVGMGTLTFGSLTAGFRAEDGFNYAGAAVVAVAEGEIDVALFL